MKTQRPRSPASINRGSSLLLVMLLVFALSIIVAGMLSALVNDKRVNHRMTLAGEARNAAEGAAEVAVAEIDRRANSYSSLSVTPLAGFTFPAAVRTFLANGHVDAASIEFKAGNLSPLPTRPITIDGSDPFYMPDIDKGHPVVMRHAYVYGKASANDPISGRPVTTYISNLVQVREQTWLNYAVFYNLDMEMHSGSSMDIHGPVHTNQNAYLTSGAGTSLEFYGALTTARGIYRKYKYGGTVTHTGSVYLPTKADPAAGDLLTMSMTQDSAMTGFKTFAENRWKNFVQDANFAVPQFNPPGLLQYIPDTPSTTSVNEMRNSAYSMIEPQLATVSSDTTDGSGIPVYAGYKGDDVENQKFSALAGLTIRVLPVSSGTTPIAWSADNRDPGFQLIYYTGETDSSRPVNRSNLPQRDPSTKRPIPHIVDLSKMSPALLTKLNDAIQVVKYVENTGSYTLGNRNLLTGINGFSTSLYGIYDRRQGYQESTTNNGLEGAHHTVQIDLAAFNTFLNAPASEWVDQTDSSLKVYWPDQSYSGVVYVQIPLLADSVTAVNARKSTDKIRPAVAPTTTAAGYAVVLRNGGGSLAANKLPQLPSNSNLRDDGFTFATNAPVYVVGHYNSDGNSATGSSSAPDTTNVATNKEVPALIAADAVTLLSNGYSEGDMAASARTIPAAAFTEVATGIIAGIVPTRLNSSGVGTNNQWAGGVHNFVRFLEDWSGDTYRYRGSVVCLFENEVSTGPWFQSEYTYWYQLPTRDLGYHAYFSGGKFPPGMPVLRTVRKISVADITAAQYASGPPTPPAAGP